MARAARPSRIHSCNVVNDAADLTRLWCFLGADARLSTALDQPSDKPLPAKLVGKGWGQLARPRLNVAWTGDQPVFLQVIHLPTDDPAEVPAMLELQLEKLSPLPVGQVVWSYEVLPKSSGSGLTAMVLLAERSGIDRMLEGLERRGFFTDRIESPLLTLVAGMQWVGDGAYLFVVRIGERRVCLVGWVAGEVLRTLNVVNLTDDDRWKRQLLDELNRLTWAGEVDGWATVAPAVHLVADEETLASWRGVLEEALGTSITPHVRPSELELAGATVRRAASRVSSANLLPAEKGSRYRQQFTDRLWMGGLLTLFAAYLVGVLIYLGMVEVQKIRQRRLADRFAVVNTGYTNTLRLKAQVQVLQETVNLRYAGLDCWLAAVEEMPEELSLDNFAFSGGQSLVISGTAPADQEPRITEFWQALRRKVVGNNKFFSEVILRPRVQRTVAGVPQIQWSFVCKIQRSEI